MLPDYPSYSAIDFARDPEFVQWVKYPRDERRRQFWTNWLAAHPAKKEEVEEARQMIAAILAEDYSPADSKQTEIWNRVRDSIRYGDPGSRKEAGSDVDHHKGWPWLKMAASLILVSGICFGSIYFFTEQKREMAFIDSADVVIMKEANNTSSPRTVILSDGSSILLQPKSEIRFPKVFSAERREVALTGEAFFEVKKDAARPFMVHSDGIVTRVLGTSFTVRSFAGEDVVVRVITGKVSVFKDQQKDDVKDDPRDGVVLTPNQQVVYERDRMQLTKSIIEDPVVLDEVQKFNFEFSDTPISEVFAEIEKAYGIDIVFDEESLSTCFLNASLSDVPLEDKLKLVCRGINATFEMMDSHIIIYGKGCNTSATTNNP